MTPLRTLARPRMLAATAALSTALATLTLGAMTGCASSKNYRKAEGLIALPTDLSQELRQKFAIQEFNAAPILVPTPAPTPTPATLAESAPSQKQRTAKAAVAAPVPKGGKPTKTFVFPNRRPAKDPIWIGEKVTFEITYFGVAAGDMTMEVMPPVLINNRKAYHLVAHATSSPVFSLFYTLDDTIESFFDYESLFSHRFHLKLNESKQTRDALELNDSEKRETYYWNRWNRFDRAPIDEKLTGPIPSFAQDSISAIYYLRTIPLTVGQVVSVPIVSEGKVWEAEVHVIRKETIDTPAGRFETIVIKPETKFKGVLQKRGDSFIWLTDDDRRLPVKVEAKVKIGVVNARLKKLERGTPP